MRGKREITGNPGPCAAHSMAHPQHDVQDRPVETSCCFWTDKWTMRAKLQATPMNIRTLIGWAVIIGGSSASVSCTSISAEQALKNEHSRLGQQRIGVEDREDGRQQKKDEERAFQEELKRKS